MRRGRGIRGKACALAALLLAAALTGCGAKSSTTETTAGETQETAVNNAQGTGPAGETQGATSGEAQETVATAEQGASMDERAEMYGIVAREVPDTEAFAFTAGLGAGINLGNTFDAYLDRGLAADLSDEMRTETCWQSAETTREIIQGIADAGFSTIRIPVSWHNHIADDDLTISPAWMARVNTVVDWSLDAGLYVILNIHHDNHLAVGGFYPDSAHLAASERYIARIWEQLAERYRDYDDRLIFEAMNEPRLVDHENEWWFDVADPNEDVRDAIACINRLNQVFVDTVRGVGGSHSTCFLMCPGYDASADGALTAGFALPTDADGIEDRLIVSVHAYTPYEFALKEDGTDVFNPWKKTDTQEIDAFMNKLYFRYIKNGTPVVIGEFGARDRGGNTEARAAYTDYYAADAWAHGMPCLWWDNNNFSGSGEEFGIYDRAACAWRFSEIRDALLVRAGTFFN